MSRSTNPTLDDAQYSDIYRGMLESVRDAGSRINYPLCSFWPSTGRKYGTGLKVLLLGRAVNGWDGLDPIRDGVPEAVKSAREEARKGLDWVTELRGPGKHYNTNRSQFWMTGGAMLRDLVDDLDLEGREWVDRLAWSNLARVAPAEGGNPNTGLWNPQAEAGKRLLELELELLSPDLVLAFSGWTNWLELLAPQELSENLKGPEGLHRHFDRAGRDRRGRVWIVTRHPQGAGGGREAFVDGLRALDQSLTGGLRS